MFIRDYEGTSADDFKNCMIRLGSVCSKNECGIGCRNIVKRAKKGKNKGQRIVGKGAGKNRLKRKKERNKGKK